MAETVHKAGSLIAISSGEYSDYGVTGFFVALETFTRSRLVEIQAASETAHEQVVSENHAAWEAWRENKELPQPSRNPSLHEYFIAQVIKAGLLLEIDYTEINIGTYGSIHID